jgi:NAD+ kinase
MSPKGEVLFVLHPRVDPADPAVVKARETVQAAGHQVEVVTRRPAAAGEEQVGGRLEGDGTLAGVELVVTFGGDGTILHAARVAVPAGVPLLGVNVGRLGFLAGVDLHDAPQALQSWVEGGCEIETRTVMRVESQGAAGIAVNDVALAKDPSANVIQVDLTVDGEYAGSFHCDGLVVATAMGSTGYALSAGGPLVDPRADVLVVAPLNAHNLATRALVVPGGMRVSLSADEPARTGLDGAAWVDVGVGDSMVCTLDGPKVKLVRPPGSVDYYQQLRDKLFWGQPLVREGRR